MWLNPPYGRKRKGVANAEDFLRRFATLFAEGAVEQGCLLLKTEHLSTVWFNTSGLTGYIVWAAAGRLEFGGKTSLSGSLRLWICEPANAITPAELILAWANLGSLIEGTIKTLLSVWYETYKADIDHLRQSGAYHKAKQMAYSPDGLTLEPLRKYCKARKLLGVAGDQLVELVQQRRNTIHAFKDRPIGDGIEFQGAVRGYLELLRTVNARLPYPDEIYKPRED